MTIERPPTISVVPTRWKAFVPTIVLAVMAVTFGGFELLGGALPVLGAGFFAAAVAYGIKGWLGRRSRAHAAASGDEPGAATQAVSPQSAVPQRNRFAWIGWVALGLFVLAAWRIADGVFRDKAIQQDLHSALAYATPIAVEARRVFEQSGHWPQDLKELPLDTGKLPPQVRRVQLLKEGTVRVVMSDATGAGGGALDLSVLARDGDRYLVCRAEGIRSGPLPSRCRTNGAAERLAWPPAKRSLTQPPLMDCRMPQLPRGCRCEGPFHG